MEAIDEELKEMYEEGHGEPKVLSSETLKQPIKSMPLKTPIVVERGTSVLAASRLMQDGHVGSVLVVKKGVLDGIFTERDLLMKVIGAGKEISKLKVEEVMTSNPAVLQPQDMIAFALNYMYVGGYRNVPIVDEQDRPVAVVSVKDVVAYLADYFPQEVLTLPPTPIRRTKAREGA